MEHPGLGLGCPCGVDSDSGSQALGPRSREPYGTPASIWYRRDRRLGPASGAARLCEVEPRRPGPSPSHPQQYGSAAPGLRLNTVTARLPLGWLGKEHTGACQEPQDRGGPKAPDRPGGPGRDGRQPRSASTIGNPRNLKRPAHGPRRHIMHDAPKSGSGRSATRPQAQAGVPGRCPRPGSQAGARTLRRTMRPRRPAVTRRAGCGTGRSSRGPTGPARATGHLPQVNVLPCNTDRPHAFQGL
jgi:hypothetical protein